MIKLNHSKRVLIVTAILALVTLVSLLIMKNGAKGVVVRVTGLNGPICTENVPPSSCLDFDLEVQDSSGKTSTYTFKGYSNGVGREEYNKRLNLVFDSFTEDNKLKITVKDNEVVTVAR